MSTQIVIMMICDGPALLIVVQNDDDDDARCYGYLVMPRRYVINDDLWRHFSLIFSNPLMTPPLGLLAEMRNTFRLSKIYFSFQILCLSGLCIHPFFFSVLCFDVIYREETLINVMKSVTRNGRSILLTAVLAIILVYLFSIVGFIFFKDDFIMEAEHLVRILSHSGVTSENVF